MNFISHAKPGVHHKPYDHRPPGNMIKKLLLTMKLTAILLTIFCLQVSATTKAQQVTLTVKNAPLEKVIKQLHEQSGYSFLYNVSYLKESVPVTVNLVSVPIDQALKIIFKDQPFDYEIQEKTIILKGRSPMPVLQPKADRMIEGYVVDSAGKPMPGVVVRIKNTAIATMTDASGYFQLMNVPANAILEFSMVGYQKQERTIGNQTEFNIKLLVSIQSLDAVSIVSTGYQQLPKERATGSFTKIDNALFNRSVGPSIIDRLDGVTSGLIFNKNYFVGDPNASAISIRGLSTIYANENPLIVVDNFPIDGPLTNLNPDDIQDITVLKDAAAASIWGARSGNGVIVINTKKGNFNRPLQVQFNTSYTLTEKPDIYYSPNFLDAADFINSEKFLFGKGFYDSQLTDVTQPVISPVVELLNEERNGTISTAQANTQINTLQNLDIRKDISKYLYRKTGTQQYALNLSGGTSKASYYFSAGYDKVPSSLVGNAYDRLNITSSSSFSPIKNLQVNAGITYSITNTTNNNSSSLSPGSSKGVYYPYAQLAGANGNPLTLPKDYRSSFISSLSGSQLLDWTYNPLEEIDLANNTTKNDYAKFNTSLKYTFLKGLDALVSYQLEKENTDNEDVQSQQTYYTRNLINLYTQTGGTQPIPLGGILDQRRSDFTGNSFRAQMDLNKTFASDHQIVAIAGIEAKQLITNESNDRQYGYSSQTGTTIPVNYTGSFVQYDNLTYPSTIPYENSLDKLTDEFFSYFANASYTYKDRYILSGSGRIDQSNLFGVNTNQKSVPLWSAGLAWDISKEAFYKVAWLPYLKLRATYGYNGNIDKSVSAYTTALFAGASFQTGAPYVIIQNPPNPELRWEQIGMLNLGADFETKNRLISGSIEYFHKNGKDILGYAPVDPTTGVRQFKGNVADMTGSGFDIDVTFHAGNKLKWAGTVLVSKATDKVTHYDEKTTLSSYLQSSDGSVGITAITPVVGRPVFSIYSYKWAGLDPSTGDPQGILNGKVSKDYASIETSSNIGDAVYNGPARPTVFGSFRNTFSYRGLSLSWNITYEFGFYFRRPSINYSSLANNWIGNSDYALRWQQPGDEAHTNVPSFIYPLNTARDNFYQYSSVLVEKGDNIRLKDISISYDLGKIIKKSPFRTLQVYGYANNLGIIWKATKSNLDPDYVISPYPDPKTFSIGLRTTF